MLRFKDYECQVKGTLNIDISKKSNPGQHNAVKAPKEQMLFIAAGPGSGKTTVITLRVLKLVFVDDVDPNSILVTTFTKRAAAELRSRILGWGDQLRSSFVKQASKTAIIDHLRKLNLNNIITGTLDSISEEVLGDYRQPGTAPPIVIEDFACNALMTIHGLFSQGRHNSRSLKNFIASLRGTRWGLNVPELSRTLREIKDRFYHDQVDMQQYRKGRKSKGIKRVCDAISDYIDVIEQNLLFDFGRLEHEFLDQLNSGALQAFLDRIRFILIDEYQDTNLLQEQIYFTMAKTVTRKGGSLTVVGDDDQSLYRFRGATVNLFQNFVTRVKKILKKKVETIYLNQNYRSTQSIVDFCNAFISLDNNYQKARVAGKPTIKFARSTSPKKFRNYPILGMFRDDVFTLADDLSDFIWDVVYGRGFPVKDHNKKKYRIKVDSRKGGSPADVALLISSPLEFAGDRERLPLLLRNELNNLPRPIQVFNPRGQYLQSILDVQRLCGLILECIDPGSTVQNSIPNFPGFAGDTFDDWRREARNYVRINPAPNKPSLRKFVNAWQKRKPLRNKKWKREVELIDLVYNLVTWIPNMQDGVEGLVYLEAVTRVINQARLFSHFDSNIIFDKKNPNLEEKSIKEAFWNAFVPLATGAIEIDEDLLETLPRGRVNIMSVHQAKGLEFPLVIVDIGSDFRSDHHAQAFKRFPHHETKACRMEDQMRPYSPLGKPKRTALDRSFDDLIRQYFVAYSRAQDVLLLTGLNTVKDGEVRNIASGWERNGTFHWGGGLPNLVHV